MTLSRHPIVKFSSENFSVVPRHVPGNARSIALGLRLGGVQIDAPGVDPGDVVIRHDLRRAA